MLDGYPQIEGQDYPLFDAWHCKAIEKLIDKSKEYQELFEESQITVGQAQKWLNMSIKYMRMMGLLNKDIKSEFIHVPIDNYIVDAVKKNGKISELFEVESLGTSYIMLTTGIYFKIRATFINRLPYFFH